MKTLHIAILACLLAIITISCKQNKTVASTESKAEKTEIKTTAEPSSSKVEVVEDNNPKPKSTEQSIKGLVVSFYSIGSGIDLDEARKFDAWISAYRTSSGQPIAFEKIGWGREGEIDYCAQLGSISQADAEQFVDGAKGAVSKCKMMHFTVNGTCKQKRN